MMQQVNLLSAELRPRREWLGIGQLLSAWGGFALILLLVSFWQGLGLWRLAAEEADQQARWLALSQSNAALRSSFDSAPEPELVTEVEELRRRLSSQALLVDVVKEYELAREAGFSRYLKDLATGHVDGLALSRIELYDGGTRVLLSGETTVPVNVPRFLKRLAERDSFSGHRFDELRLEADESGLLRFQIVGPEPESRG